MFTVETLVVIKVDVKLLVMVTVANSIAVKVVGVAVLVVVETDVMVWVVEVVSWMVVGVVLVSVVVVTWMGTKRVDWVIEVKTVDMDMVVKSVTIVPINRVGISPFMTKAVLADWRLTTPVPVTAAAELLTLAGLLVEAPRTLKTAPATSVPVAEFANIEKIIRGIVNKFMIDNSAMIYNWNDRVLLLV